HAGVAEAGGDGRVGEGQDGADGVGERAGAGDGRVAGEKAQGRPAGQRLAGGDRRSGARQVEGTAAADGATLHGEAAGGERGVRGDGQGAGVGDELLAADRAADDQGAVVDQRGGDGQ